MVECSGGQVTVDFGNVIFEVGHLRMPVIGDCRVHEVWARGHGLYASKMITLEGERTLRTSDSKIISQKTVECIQDIFAKVCRKKMKI